MSALGDLLLGNALGAAVLALLVALASPMIRRPALRHLLWLLVLARCFALPVVEWAVLPPVVGEAPESRPLLAEPLPVTFEPSFGFLEACQDPVGVLAAPGCGSGLATFRAMPPTFGDSMGATTEVGAPSVAPSSLEHLVASVAQPAPMAPETGGEQWSAQGWNAQYLGALPWSRWLGTAWWLGALLVGAFAMARVLALGHALGKLRPAEAAVVERARELARELGLRRCPPILVTPLRMTPVVWAPLSRPRIVLPTALLERLSTAERDTVLAHELAHVARRDHWVRWLELLASVVFWWHPGVFWARRELRDAEERCCDQRVLEVLPSHGRAYAEALLETLDFTSRRGGLGTLPAFGSGLETQNRAVRRLSGRLTMILRPGNFSRLHPSIRLALGATALAALLVVPIRSSHAGDGEGESSTDTASPMVAERQAELEELEREREIFELEAEEHQAHVERARERTERMKERWDIESRALRADLDRAKAEGDQEQIKAIQRQIEIREQHHQLDLDRQALDLERMEATLDLSREARENALAVRREALEGREDMARQIEERQRLIEDKVLAREQEMAEKARALEERHVALEKARLEAHRERIAEHAGVREELIRRQAEIERERVEIAMRYEAERAEREAERQRRELKRALAAGEISQTEAEVTFKRYEVEARERNRELLKEEVAREMEMIQHELPRHLEEMRERLAEAGESQSELAAKLEALSRQIDEALAQAAEGGEE